MKKHGVLCVALMGFALAVFGQTGADFSWSENNGEITITRYNGAAKAVTIPASINGKPVVHIGENVFWKKQLTSVTIPTGVTSIGSGAFYDNPLTSVTMMTNPSTLFDGFSGPLRCFFRWYGRGSGTYELRNGQWHYNGTALPQPAELVCQGLVTGGFDKNGSIYITKIDGKAASPNTPGREEIKIPAGFMTGSVFVPPGLHRIEVGWIRRTDDRGLEYSKGTVTFEHVVTLESGIYDLTGVPQGDQIQFGIKKRQ